MRVESDSGAIGAAPRAPSRRARNLAATLLILRATELLQPGRSHTSAAQLAPAQSQACSGAQSHQPLRFSTSPPGHCSLWPGCSSPPYQPDARTHELVSASLHPEFVPTFRGLARIGAGLNARRQALTGGSIRSVREPGRVAAAGVAGSRLRPVGWLAAGYPVRRWRVGDAVQDDRTEDRERCDVEDPWGCRDVPSEDQ